MQKQSCASEANVSPDYLGCQVHNYNLIKTFPSLSFPHEFSVDELNAQMCHTALLAPTGALVLMMVYHISGSNPLFQIFTQSLDAIDVRGVTLKRLNSINADDVTRYLGDILGIFWGYFWNI